LTGKVTVIDRFGEQLRSAFPADAITRVQVLEYGDDPEIEPEKTAIRVFFDWPGRTEGKKADPKTVHVFVNANGAAINKLGDELPPFIGWVELRPEGLSGTSRDDGLAFRIGGRRGLA
jgi:hypothetical protein